MKNKTKKITLKVIYLPSLNNMYQNKINVMNKTNKKPKIAIRKVKKKNY